MHQAAAPPPLCFACSLGSSRLAPDVAHQDPRLPQTQATPGHHHAPWRAHAGNYSNELTVTNLSIGARGSRPGIALGWPGVPAGALGFRPATSPARISGLAPARHPDRNPGVLYEHAVGSRTDTLGLRWGACEVCVSLGVARLRPFPHRSVRRGGAAWDLQPHSARATGTAACIVS